MKLSSLLEYNSIIIQCHDNPDADAICSGYVLYRYFESHGKKVRFIYSGNFKISKSNLVYLINKLKIPIEYISKITKKPDLLLMTDCQYGEGNVHKFKAKNIAVIDHHQVSTSLPKLNEVRSNLGSCCTAIWYLLKLEEDDSFFDKKISTALYYGLYSDTNAFSEISHPLDRDMIESLDYDSCLLRKLKNMNLSLREARVAGVAMLGIEYHENGKYAILRSEPCDPNILGLIGDFIIAIDSVDVCLVYSILSFGVKYSIRSCSRETRADELAVYLADKLGSGGGHIEKAGGLLKNELIKRQYPDYVEIDDSNAEYSISNIIKERLNSYFEDTDIIYVKKSNINIKSMRRYSTSNITVGIVDPRDFVSTNAMAIIRTIFGDKNIEINNKTKLVITESGEVVSITNDNYLSNYSKTRKKFVLNTDYYPTIKIADTGKTFSLMDFVKPYISTGRMNIRAKKLNKTTKLFTVWDNEKYMLGYKGDYLAVSEDDENYVFIISKDQFSKTYSRVIK
jgi:phosphoglycolate phosphatase